MSRNGSGVYAAPESSFPAVANTLIESAKFNNIITDIAAALTASMAADGQTTVTGDIPMNSHKHTGLAAGSASGHSVEYDQMREASKQIQELTASVAANALTVTYGGGVLDFRNGTLTNGEPNNGVSVASSSITVPSSATLGTVNGIAARLVFLVAYNGGSPVLCVANLAGGVNLNETTLISPTTISSGATSSSTIYSASAVSASSPFRVVGYVDITEATAGTWATGPTVVQGSGGQALSGLSSLGYGQTWQNMTGSRAIATTYYNTTGKPIYIVAQMYSTVANAIPQLTCQGQTIDNNAQSLTGSPNFACVAGIIPPGASYSATLSLGVVTLAAWHELR